MRLCGPQRGNEDSAVVLLSHRRSSCHAASTDAAPLRNARDASGDAEEGEEAEPEGRLATQPCPRRPHGETGSDGKRECKCQVATGGQFSDCAGLRLQTGAFYSYAGLACSTCVGIY